MLKPALMVLPLLTLCAFALVSCDEPIPAHQKTVQWRVKDLIKGCSEYSVRLADIQDNPVKAHKYKVVCGKLKEGVTETTRQANVKDLDFKTSTTDWIPVDSQSFRNNLGNLDRTVLSKDASGKVDEIAKPPGYQYVGNQDYGQWKTNDQGDSFWEFYGKYAMFSSLMDAGRPVYRRDYDDYRDHRDSGRTYYTPGYQKRVKYKYTNRKPDFYQRTNTQATKYKNTYYPKSSKTTYKKTAPSKPGKKPLTFKERMELKKTEGQKSNISGYGVKSAKKFQKKAAPAPTPKKKKSFYQNVRKKVSKPFRRTKSKSSSKSYKSKRR